jgi:hypothetical protein
VGSVGPGGPQYSYGPGIPCGICGERIFTGRPLCEECGAIRVSAVWMKPGEVVMSDEQADE